MELVDGNGQKLNAEPKKLVDATGDEVSSEQPKAMTTKEIGEQLANHMITKAGAFPTNELINKQMDVLYHAALNILAHRVLNIGLGFAEESPSAIVEWNASRAFAAEKQVQEDLSEAVTNWKGQYFNGELVYHPSKKD